jgi:hypothetical protein
MKKFISLLFLCSVVGAQAQIILDNFNTGTATGAVVGSTSWVGQVTQNATTITVGGTANDDNGWGTTSASVNATGMSFVTFTAQRDSGNAASSLTIQFEDVSLNTQVYSFSTSAFSIGSLSTVSVALAWTGGFDPTQITGWNIGGGAASPGSSAFRMTFDNLALTAVPEPSTYAAILGGLALGFAAWRRRSALRA